MAGCSSRYRPVRRRCRPRRVRIATTIATTQDEFYTIHDLEPTAITTDLAECCHHFAWAVPGLSVFGVRS